MKIVSVLLILSIVDLSTPNLYDVRQKVIQYLDKISEKSIQDNSLIEASEKINIVKNGMDSIAKNGLNTTKILTFDSSAQNVSTQPKVARSVRPRFFYDFSFNKNKFIRFLQICLDGTNHVVDILKKLLALGLDE